MISQVTVTTPSMMTAMLIKTAAVVQALMLTRHGCALHTTQTAAVASFLFFFFFLVVVLPPPSPSSSSSLPFITLQKCIFVDQIVVVQALGLTQHGCALPT